MEGVITYYLLNEESDLNILNRQRKFYMLGIVNFLFKLLTAFESGKVCPQQSVKPSQGLFFLHSRPFKRNKYVFTVYRKTFKKDRNIFCMFLSDR